MKRTTLRTSAIALGVAVALPATAQEWNMGWGGKMSYHVVFGSTDTTGTKRTTYKEAVPEVPLVPAVTGPTITRTYNNSEVTLTAVTYVPLGSDPWNAQDVLDTSAGNLSNLDAAQVRAARTILLTDTNGDGIGNDLPDLAALQTELEDSDLTLADEVQVYFASANPNEAFVITPAVAAVPAIAEGHVTSEAIADSNAKSSGGGMRSDTEVYFTPSVTLDNGLTFGATIEFEADAAGVDQNFISVTGDGLGTLKIGKHGKTGLGVGAPSVGMGINSGDHQHFIALHKGEGASSGTNTSIIGNADRISYTTPKGSLGGFGFGISYAPGGDTDDGRTSGFVKSDPAAGKVSDNIDVSLKFAQAFGDANFELGMRYGTAKQEKAKKNPRNFGIGASVGFGDFTFGGAYADTVKEKDGKDLSASGWSLGMSYAMDEAWTLGIETYQGESDNGGDHSAYKIAASRTLGTGVKWDVYAITANSKDIEAETDKVKNVATITEGKGTIFGTSINLNF